MRIFSGWKINFVIWVNSTEFLTEICQFRNEKRNIASELFRIVMVAIALVFFSYKDSYCIRNQYQ